MTDARSPSRHCAVIEGYYAVEPDIRVKDVAKRMGVCQGYVSRLRITSRKLLPLLMQRWTSDVHPLPDLVVYRIARLSPSSQTAAYEAALTVAASTQRIDEKFFTPPGLAERVVREADVKGYRVLEPSAGHGSLVKECLEQGAIHVDMIEKDSGNRDVLAAITGATLLNCREFAGFDTVERYDRIVMNPPFSRDIAHVMKAYSLLAPGGRLVAILPVLRKNRLHRKRTAFLKFVAEAGGTITNHPPYLFSGHKVRTYYVTLTLPW
jgi:predicted RNA methylase